MTCLRQILPGTCTTSALVRARGPSYPVLPPFLLSSAAPPFLAFEQNASSFHVPPPRSQRHSQRHTRSIAVISTQVPRGNKTHNHPHYQPHSLTLHINRTVTASFFQLDILGSRLKIEKHSFWDFSGTKQTTKNNQLG
jgi:hypothetical protein